MTTMGRSKQQLIEDIARQVLANSPATAEQIRQSIVNSGRRHVPTSREITFALRGIKDFVLLDKVDTPSLTRVRSHKVNLWGIRGRKYKQ